MNHDLVGLTPLQCLDKIVAYCGQEVRRIILDHHSSERNRFMQEPLWYVYYMMEERFIAVWVMLPIVAADLWNELKKNSTWSSGDLTTDWRLAAERVSNAIQQAVNPDWLLMVDVESTTWCLWPGSSPYAAVPGQDMAYCGLISLLRSSNKANNFYNEQSWYLPGNSYYRSSLAKRLLLRW